MQKEPLLFLCHRIPFPPNKGDKIRSFNMLKALSRDFDIYLGAFVDDPFDWQYTEKLDQYCAGKLLLNQNKLWSKIKGLTGFLTGNAISIPYYHDSKMRQWVNQTLVEHKIKNVFVYSSVMAQYVNHLSSDDVRCVVDFVDVDSDKWRQYAEGKSGIASWFFGREHKTLQQFENQTAKHACHSLFVSPQEAQLFKQQVPVDIHHLVMGMLNGVDTKFFDPDAEFDAVAAEAIDAVFTGAMDYWANVDAVLWFVKNVWPLVRKHKLNAKFYIVGGNPTAEVLALDNNSGITVTGRVKDVRPFIKQSHVCVAPLQIARGIQNKVLEAMSMAKPTVATSMAIEGIDTDTQHVKVTDDPELFSQLVIEYMEGNVIAGESRQWILDNLQWKATLAGLPQLFDKD